LAGLEKLTELYSYVWVFANESLETLTGLDNVTSITGRVEISGNISLTSLSGLGSLVSIGGQFKISGCTSLSNLTGVGSLETIGGGLFISGCDNLEDLTGIGNLTTIEDAGIGIDNNDNLESLSGIDNLETIGGNLRITQNSLLVNLTGLENLNSINGFIEIISNNLIVSLSGIQNIDPNSISSVLPEETPDLSIFNNPNLSECEVQSICDFLDLPDKVKDVHDNKIGCDNVAEIEDACEVESTPSSTYLLSPADGDEDVIVTIELSWEEVDGADGYILSIGTTSEGGEILDNEDLGDVVSYTPESLPCGSEIFIKIIPYNSAGNAEESPEESFFTESVTANVEADVSYCFGGSAQLLAEGGTTFHWLPETGINDPDIANPIANPTETTVYTVSVSNEGRCEELKEVTVTVNSLPKPNISSTAITAVGLADGTATCSPTEGTPDYSFKWSNNKPSQTITELAANKYLVTVTDANLCSSTDSVVINEFACPTLTIIDSVIDVSCFNNCDGAISILEVTNGVAPFTYVWDVQNGTDSTISSLCEEIYSVTVTDSKNCTVSQTFEVSQPSQIFANISTTNETAIDANDGTASCNPNGGSSNYKYFWSTEETTNSISGLSPGFYSLIVTDSAGCSIIDSFEIKKYVEVELNVNYIKKNVTCFGDNNGSLEIVSVEGAFQPLTYLWSTGDTFPKISNLYAGDYSVTITDIDNRVVIDTFKIFQLQDIIFETIDIRNITGNYNGAILVQTNLDTLCDFKWTGPNGFTSNSRNISGLTESGCYSLSVKVKFFGCTKDTTICITNTSSTINSNDLSNYVNIYPNPAKNSVNIDFTETVKSKARISIFDMSGKQHFIITKSTDNSIVSIDLKSLHSGLFIVKIESQNEIVFKKLFIEE